MGKGQPAHLDANDETVHEKGVLREGGVEDTDHGGGEESPGEELEEDDDEGVVDGGVADAGGRDDALGHLLGRVPEYHVHHPLPHLKLHENS